MDNRKELIERLRTESLYKDKATLEIMDLCMEAAGALAALMEECAQLHAEVNYMQSYNADAEKTIENLCAELEQVKRERDGIKVAFEDVASKPDCNTCCDRSCMYRPRAGETTRFNCPLWLGPQKEE